MIKDIKTNETKSTDKSNSFFNANLIENTSIAYNSNKFDLNLDKETI